MFAGDVPPTSAGQHQTLSGESPVLRKQSLKIAFAQDLTSFPSCSLQISYRQCLRRLKTSSSEYACSAAQLGLESLLILCQNVQIIYPGRGGGGGGGGVRHGQAVQWEGVNLGSQSAEQICHASTAAGTGSTRHKYLAAAHCWPVKVETS